MAWHTAEYGGQYGGAGFAASGAVRSEFRVMLANLACSIGREDLVQWCYEAPSVSLPPFPVGCKVLEHICNGMFGHVWLGEDMTNPTARPVGHTRVKGNVWYVTFHAADGKRKTARLGRVEDLTEEQARDRAKMLVQPSESGWPTDPTVTLAQFVETRFVPDYVTTKKQAGKCHYNSMFKLILPSLGDKVFQDITHRDLQRLIDQKKADYSWQTIKHIRNVLSAIFRHGIERTGLYTPKMPGVNPARGLILPPKKLTRRPDVLTIEECRALLAALPAYPHRPVREISRLAILCSLRRMEFTSLRWRRVNLTDERVRVDDEWIAPRSIFVDEGYYKGVFDTTKTPGSVRVVPVPPKVIEELAALRGRGHHLGPDDLVFCTKTGEPYSIDKLAHDIFRPVVKRLMAQGLCRHITFRGLRHTHDTLVSQVGMQLLDVAANMGHMGSGNMTLHYMHPSIEVRRQFVEKLSELIDG